MEYALRAPLNPKQGARVKDQVKWFAQRFPWCFSFLHLVGTIIAHMALQQIRSTRRMETPAIFEKKTSDFHRSW